jgi:PrtD family type I secretion system ABC transporter
MEAERQNSLTRALAACRRVLIVVALFSACVNLLMLTVPMYMLQVYDRVLTTGNVDTLLALSAMVLVALATFGLLDAVRMRILARAGVWLDRELGSPVLAGAVAEARRSGGGVSAQGLRDLSTLRGYLGGAGIMPLFDAPWSPVFLAVVFAIHPVLGWIGFGGALVLLGFAVANDRATRRKLLEANEASVRALNAADAAIRNADAITAMGMLPALAQRWRQTTDRGLDLQTGANDASGGIGAVAKFFRLCLQASMLGVGGYLVLGNQMSAGSIVASAVVLARGLAPLEQLISAWRNLVSARSAYDRLTGLLDRAPADAARTVLPRPTGRIELDKVTYVPPGMRLPIIRPATLRLAAGDVLGIVGPSGAGKTTLVRLLVGSLQPSAGHVRLDGADVAVWPDADRGRHVGYLPQTVELFAGTVRDNIARLGAASDDEVLAAAQLAGAHETILGLPEGYDTPIGEGGVPISGGQRQRIALARALFGNPALVVLDEPNAHLDGDGELALAATVRQLRERDITVVLIAQRAGVMAQVDKVLVIKRGAMEAFGPRDEILPRLRRANLAAVRPGA